jgi:hypothetical protein
MSRTNPLTVIAEVNTYDLNEDGTTTHTGGHTIVAGESRPAMYAMRNDYGVSLTSSPPSRTGIPALS